MSRSSSNHSQTLRQISATLFFLTFVLTLTTTITTSLTNDPFVDGSLSTYPLMTSAFATVYTFTLTILTLLSLRRRDSRRADGSSQTALRSAALPLSTTLLSTLFSGLLIGTTYLSRFDALLPCTAGTTSYNDPYVTYCQLRQTVFWSAVLGAVGFAALAVLGGVLVLRGRRVASYSGDFVRHEDGSRGRSDEGDAVSVAPPSYAEKEGDVEAEGEWEERRGGAV